MPQVRQSTDCRISRWWQLVVSLASPLRDNVAEVCCPRRHTAEHPGTAATDAWPSCCRVPCRRTSALLHADPFMFDCQWPSLDALVHGFRLIVVADFVPLRIRRLLSVGIKNESNQVVWTASYQRPISYFVRPVVSILPESVEWAEVVTPLSTKHPQFSTGATWL